MFFSENYELEILMYIFIYLCDVVCYFWRGQNCLNVTFSMIAYLFVVCIVIVLKIQDIPYPIN